MKFANVPPGDIRFKDVPVTHWAYDYINTAANFGWVSGVGNGMFEPDRNITSAEAVTLMNHVLHRYPDKAHINSNSDLIRFADVDSNAWFYYEVMEALNGHDYRKDGKKEIWIDNNAELQVRKKEEDVILSDEEAPDAILPDEEAPDDGE